MAIFGSSESRGGLKMADPVTFKRFALDTLSFVPALVVKNSTSGYGTLQLMSILPSRYYIYLFMGTSDIFYLEDNGNKDNIQVFDALKCKCCIVWTLCIAFVLLSPFGMNKVRLSSMYRSDLHCMMLLNTSDLLMCYPHV